MAKNKKKSKRSQQLYTGRSKTDPQGSYTGVGRDAREKPVQDADDL